MEHWISRSGKKKTKGSDPVGLGFIKDIGDGQNFNQTFLFINFNQTCRNGCVTYFLCTIFFNIGNLLHCLNMLHIFTVRKSSQIPLFLLYFGVEIDLLKNNYFNIFIY